MQRWSPATFRQRNSSVSSATRFSLLSHSSSRGVTFTATIPPRTDFGILMMGRHQTQLLMCVSRFVFIKCLHRGSWKQSVRIGFESCPTKTSAAHPDPLSKWWLTIFLTFNSILEGFLHLSTLRELVDFLTRFFRGWKWNSIVSPERDKKKHRERKAAAIDGIE